MRLIILIAAIAITAANRGAADQIIYDDALENGWQNWSWATVNFANPSPVHGGQSSISVSAGSYQALYLDIVPTDSSLFTNLTFWINGGSTGGQFLQLQGLSNHLAVAQTPWQIGPLPTNSWRQVTVSLTALGVARMANFSGFWLQNPNNTTLPTYYVDDIALVTNAVSTLTNPPVTIVINAGASQHPISPLIYGVAFAPSSNVLQDLNVPLHRSGGNSTTRYNWQINATSHAADWYFESIGEASNAPGGDGDDFITESKGGGAQAMLTIPILGYVAKLGANRSILASFNTNKYGVQTATDPYLPSAGNGVALNGANLTNNNPTDANQPATTNFQAGWVQHLTNQWGRATNGGLRYYLMDNEWSLWSSTHRDVHPAGATMDEVLGDFSNYAAMVKGIDPGALVLGPEEWGWPGYLYSGSDQAWSGANNNYNPANYPDRKAHGGLDFGPWFLRQLSARDQAAGQRLLDVFTLHCYPQEGSVGGDAVDPATELLRNQSTRQFWDTNYVDPSWINSVIALIPRMKSWVATNYPGTKTGITEYNWGAESSPNGATAQADILGIFGREDLDLATRWTTPAAGTPTYQAIKMYRNYDGKKSTFGDNSILTTVPNPDSLSAFAAVRNADHALTIMVINKDLNNVTPFNASITNFNATGSVQRWQLSASNVITRLPDRSITNHVLSDLVPAQSITLYVLPVVNPFSLRIVPQPGQVTIWLNGQTGVSYTLLSSTNLVQWNTMATNLLTSNTMSFRVGGTNSPLRYYRGQWLP